MAVIDDLIAQIEDKALRERLREEVKRLTKEKKFGLVFEKHLLKLTPVYSASIRPGSLAVRRDGPLNQTWRVLGINEGMAHCYNPSTGEQTEMAVADLVVVKRVMRKCGYPPDKQERATRMVLEQAEQFRLFVTG